MSKAFRFPCLSFSLCFQLLTIVTFLEEVEPEVRVEVESETVKRISFDCEELGFLVFFASCDCFRL